MAFLLRPPRPADAAPLAALHVETWRQTYAGLMPAETFGADMLRSRRRLWDRALNDPRADMRIRLAEAGGQLIGFAWSGDAVGNTGTRPPRDLQLYALYVDALHHGGGAGQALLNAVLGDEPAVLWVAKENSRAVAFYRRNGFVPDGTEQVEPTAPDVTDIRMVR
ncbi:GNAT family N-acetyltransferase [Microbacterium sp. SSW1-59]|uniref:GNAT family N-acetyltransferase n=1 Tax=Microbacterium xanthum TaxID=3079794 RepID=UPI002AD3CEF3|nr:GNAT family N-acetyltransferase [Microbacterium sp. SSW1-59]MDZ8200476.1 GNAT family N-acetyltransferase [Microbacterium sp. SSW1-59]